MHWELESFILCQRKDICESSNGNRTDSCDVLLSVSERRTVFGSPAQDCHVHAVKKLRYWSWSLQPAASRLYTVESLKGVWVNFAGNQVRRFPYTDKIVLLPANALKRSCFAPHYYLRSRLVVSIILLDEITSFFIGIINLFVRFWKHMFLQIRSTHVGIYDQ